MLGAGKPGGRDRDLSVNLVRPLGFEVRLCLRLVEGRPPQLEGHEGEQEQGGRSRSRLQGDGAVYRHQIKPSKDTARKAMNGLFTPSSNAV